TQIRNILSQFLTSHSHRMSEPLLRPFFLVLDHNAEGRMLLGRTLLRKFPTAILQECDRSEEHTSELQSQSNLVCRLLLEQKNTTTLPRHHLWASRPEARDPLLPDLPPKGLDCLHGRAVSGAGLVPIFRFVLPTGVYRLST